MPACSVNMFKNGIDKYLVHVESYMRKNDKKGVCLSTSNVLWMAMSLNRVSSINSNVCRTL